MKKTIVISVIFGLAVIGAWFLLEFFKPIEQETEHEEKTSIYQVDLQGEVIIPKVYDVVKGTSLAQIIEFALGVTADADLDKIDLSQIITKDIVIKIPRKISNDVNQRYDLNKVSYQELLIIPYITDRIAINILIYRENNKHFYSVEELLLVKYIGEKTFEKIQLFFFIE